MCHWAKDYIGIRYTPGGRDRKTGLDCWGFIRLVYYERKRIELPVLPGVAEGNFKFVAGQIEKHMAHWEEITEPFEACVVGMSQKRVLHHVGIWTFANGGMVLHAIPKAGVLAEPLRNLSLRGFQIVRYFSYHGVDHRSPQCVSTPGGDDKTSSPWGDYNSWLVNGD